MVLYSTRNYIIIKNIVELNKAKTNPLCRHIIYEQGDCITIWDKIGLKWNKVKYDIFGHKKEVDIDITGRKAYMDFYYYCGEEEIEKMKSVYPIIDVWDSHEQMHFFNMEYVGEKIYQDVYVYDANSAFTYGAMQLPDEFYKLKEYMQELYNFKMNANNKITRNKYKNLQNFLIGYFARIKKLVAVRSNIILNSNMNIKKHMNNIIKYGGKVFLSNTDSIITDKIGNKVMQDSIGQYAGQFKLEKTSDRLYYNSSNSYQIGDKITFSGVKYFARKHTDFFKDRYAEQEGNIVYGKDFDFEYSNEKYKNICRVEQGLITVKIYNNIGELVDTIMYKTNIK